MRRKLWPVTVLLVLGGVALGCGGQEFDSRWVGDRAVAVDGALTEWEGATKYLEEDRVSIGIQNDDRFLYLSLSSADQYTQTQVLMRGVTVWFDPEGGTRRTFGVRFPLPQRQAAPPSDRQRRPIPEDPDLDAIIHRLQGSGAEMEIVGSDGEARRTMVDDAGDVEVALNRVNGVLVYELKVPLGEGGLAIAENEGSLGMGFETATRERRGGAGGLGGGRSGFGGGLGRPGLAPGGFGVEMREPLRGWTTVTLASIEN